MRFRHAFSMAALMVVFCTVADAQSRYSGRSGTGSIYGSVDRSALGGGGHHALGGGGYHYSGGGRHHHGGHHHHHGGGYYGGGYFGGGYYAGYSQSLFFAPGITSYSAPGYSFFSGTTTVLPEPVLSPAPTGGYYYSAPGYFLDPYGPPIERPGIYQVTPADNQAQIDKWLDENRQAWEDPVDEFPIEQRPERFVRPSSADARIRSLRFQHEGDLQLKDLQYTIAARRYEEAISTAPDLSESYFRLAVADAGRGQHTDAVRRLKMGLQLNADWPETCASLEELLGFDNLLARTLLKQRVADWTREDIRDPDRLFLLGVVLYLDGDDRSQTLFESAARLGGMGFHLALFLHPNDLQQAQAESVEEPAPPILPPARNPEPVPDPTQLLPPLPEPPVPEAPPAG